jgi:hypothetical protein
MRGQIAHDRDCTAAGTRLLAMRKHLTLIIEEFTALGGVVPLPTVNERLKENFRPVSRARIVKIAQPKSKLKLRKRHLMPRA